MLPVLGKKAVLEWCMEEGLIGSSYVCPKCGERSATWDQYQSEDSVSRRPVPGRPRATTPAEDRFLALSAQRRTTTVPQLVADHFQASGRRISATTVRNRLPNAGLYARRPVVCVPLNG
ncbi:HTH_Tnp_Tc3_2 domain-containing protein [Trichonephila clavipes]|nr:HTH_Tnp_Tc3_2 domain-containing protein [Trichonephila clavipes]